MALEEQTAREKAQIEATARRTAFAAEVKGACDAGLITTPREASLLKHFDKHGEASARDSFDDMKATAPIVRPEKVGGAPAVSLASGVLTDAQKARAKELGVSEDEYSVAMFGQKGTV
jgi:hypothetical protein